MVRWAWLFLLCGCGAGKPEAELTLRAIECHDKMLHVADAPGSCEERRIKVDLLVASDADCIYAYGEGVKPHLECWKDGGP